jgi:uncharacterized protein (DUF169 family)
MAEQFKGLLGLRTDPVTLSFRDIPLAGVPRVVAPAPSGCTYWKQVAEGRAFYTEASNHYSCPIGAHTHGIDLPPEGAEELQRGVATMIDLGYIRAEEVAGIPRRSGAFGGAGGRGQCRIGDVGCIGNRVYTTLADDELYFAVPGKELSTVVDKLATIVNANRELESYHRAHASQH